VAPKLDTYTIRARRLPMLIAALPLGLAVIAVYPDGAPWWSALWGLVVWSGGAYLLAQFGRDPGKQKEAELWESWGGAPATRRLRHTRAENPVLVSHLHKQFGKQFPELRFPTPDEEAADPTHADHVYETVVMRLRERTRGNPLVFEENCSYGFRRNLWGLKSAGLTLAGAGVALSCGLLTAHTRFGLEVDLPLVAIAAILSAALLLAWVFRITRGWVRMPAEAYAERLLAAGVDAPGNDSKAEISDERQS
jgi:hypothetical protein